MLSHRLKLALNLSLQQHKVLVHWDSQNTISSLFSVLLLSTYPSNSPRTIRQE
jgi:hypothetical protein